MSNKVDTVIMPIHDTLYQQYQMVYGKPPGKLQIETIILDELLSFNKIFTVKDVLYFSNVMLRLYDEYIPREMFVWKKFVFCHFVFLFQKKMFSFDSWLLGLLLDSVTRENIKEIQFLELLSDKKFMIELYYQAMIIDYKTSFNNPYQMDLDRIKRFFRVICKQVESDVKKYQKDYDLEFIKKKVMENLKEYQTKTLLKRSVR